MSYEALGMPCSRQYRGKGKISPNWPPFPDFGSRPLPEIPVKCPVSVRVENTPFNRSVCQNSPDFDVSYGLLMALESRIILTHAFTHPAPGKAEKTRI